MASKINYKTKRNIIIISIIAILFIISFVSTYFYIKANNEAQAVSENNTNSDVNQSEQTNTEENNNQPNNTEEEQQPNTEENEENNVEENNSEANNSGETTTNVAENTENDNNENNTTENNTQTQTITTIQRYETESTVVYFSQTDLDLALDELNANIPDLTANIEAVTGKENNYVVSGNEITYNIQINNNKENELEQIEVSAMLPEGTELVENTISDNGTIENGKITWTVDVADSKTVSFTVKVTETTGNIVATAVVNGIDTNEVTNTIDEAPVLTLVEPELYQIEAGTEYTEKGYSAIDAIDGDITENVVLTYKFLPAGETEWEDVETIATNVLGTYEITYTVTDSIGNTVQQTRTFEVIDTTAPVITIKDGYVGNLEKNVYSNVSFKLYDNIGIYGYKINDGEYKEVTVNNWSDANFDNIKDKLVYGVNTITLKDIAGNETTYEFVYDNQLPTITVKDGYVGSKDKNVYSNVSFKLYDEYEVIAYKINDGEYGEFIANTSSDANFDNIKGRLVYGKNTITLKDIAGNEATYEFVYDNQLPTITVKDGYVGSKDKNVFSNVSFKLYDEYEVIAYKINDGEYGEFTANTTSDANFDNIKDRLVYGTNTITLKDVAGNEATYEFTYDNIAPIYSLLGLHNDTHYNNGGDVTVANTGDSIRLQVHFTEKLATEPTLVIKGTNKTTEFTCTFRPDSSSDTTFVYMADFRITEEMNLPQGDIQFEIYGYADEAGNVGDTLTNENINWSRFPKVEYDTIAPVYNNMGIFNWTNDNSGKDRTIAKTGDYIRLFVSFPEMLAVNPKVDILGNDGKVTNYTLEYSEGAGFYYTEFYITEDMDLPEGKIQFKVYGYEDAAGNVGTTLTEEDTLSNEYPEVEYDSIAPQYTALGIVNATHYDAGEGDIYHVKTNDDVRILIQFDEEKLAVMPKIRVLGQNNEVVKEVDMVYADITSANLNTNAYSGQFKITEDMNLPEGEIKFEIYGYADEAGNIGDVLDNEDLKYPTIDEGVIYDKTNPEVVKVQLLDKTNEDKLNIKNGETVRVMATFTEKLGTLPTLKIGEQTVRLEEIPGDNGEVRYQGDITIASDEQTLQEGLLQFTIGGYADLAGNVGSDITETDGRVSGIEYDRTAPTYSKLGITNITHYYDGGDITLAGKEDQIRILVFFDEKLAVEPKVRILGKDNKVLKDNIACAYSEETSKSQNTNAYLANFNIKDELLNLPDGEKIKFEVYGYADAAGNVGTTLTNTEINYDPYLKVVYDETPPEFVKLGIARNKDENDTRDQKYAKNGDSVRVLIYFNERLQVEPTVEMYGKTYTATYRELSSSPENNVYYYMADIDMTDDITEGEIEFKIYGYSDAAGNVGIELDNEDINNETYPKVIYDKTAPEISLKSEQYMEVEKGTEFVDPGLNIKDLTETETAIKVYYSETGEDGTWKDVAENAVDTSKLLYYNIWYTVTDKAGNVSQERRQVKVVDTTVPAADVFRVTNISRKDSNGSWLQTAKKGDTIRVIVSMKEELDPNYYPMLKINGKVMTRRMSWDSNMKAYTYDYTIQDEQDGKLEFEVYDYKDLAGNSGVALTNKDINHKEQNGITIDNTAPIVKLYKYEKENTGKTELETDKWYDYSLSVMIEDNSEYTAVLKDQNGEIVDFEEGKEIGKRKNYTLLVTDIVGNETTIKFGIDKDAPTIEGVKEGETYKEVTPTITDLNLDKVTYTFNNGTETDYVKGMTFNIDGEYTITAIDKAGNTNKITFTIENSTTTSKELSQD